MGMLSSYARAFVVAVIGGYLGDEAKGKLVDFLARHYDVVVRYQGGENSAHTLVVAGVKFVLHLIPSGILHAKCLCILAQGMVINPWKFLEEVAALQKADVDAGPNRIRISGRATMVLSHHKAVEVATGAAARIGTTIRGIGSAYTDFVGRHAIRFGDLLYPNTLMEKIYANLRYNNLILSGAGEKEVNAEELFVELMSIRNQILPYIEEDTGHLLRSLIGKNARILLEGAQADGLDLMHGGYPNVTSSFPTAGGACLSTGIPPASLNGVILVLKAYGTFVGNHIVPCVMDESLATIVREKGNEYGGSTKRPRGIAWFDARAAKEAVERNGADALALMKLDVLDGFAEVLVCTGYKRDGKFLEATPMYLNGVEPVYQRLDGWDNTAGVTNWADLHGNAQEFVEFVYRFTGCGIPFISTGADREHTIVREELLNLPWFR